MSWKKIENCLALIRRYKNCFFFFLLAEGIHCVYVLYRFYTLFNVEETCIVSYISATRVNILYLLSTMSIYTVTASMGAYRRSIYNK